MIAEYLIRVGADTDRDIRIALSLFLLDRFKRNGRFKRIFCPAGREAVYLATGAAMNAILGDIDLEGVEPTSWMKERGYSLASAHVPPETFQFARENAKLLKAEIRELSADNHLCVTLSGAAYNISYGRYIKAGGSRGIFSNHFLTYVRTLFSKTDRDRDFHMKRAVMVMELGLDILKPFDGMLTCFLLRPFPRNPDEQAYYRAVREFTEEMLALEKTQKITPDKPQEITPADTDRIMREYVDGYPTTETLGEFWEAHKNGGQDAIRALLEKRRAARLKQTPESASDT